LRERLLPGLGPASPDAAALGQARRPAGRTTRSPSPVGTGGWTASGHAGRHGEIIPVAASGGWLDAQTLRAEVILLEIPHRMDITCSLPARTAEAVWRNPPLTPGRLQDLHCPG
jgi:hypothetical protein